jgi:hypothetical protein
MAGTEIFFLLTALTIQLKRARQLNFVFHFLIRIIMNGRVEGAAIQANPHIRFPVQILATIQVTMQVTAMLIH